MAEVDARYQEYLNAGYKPEQILSCPKRAWCDQCVPAQYLCPCQLSVAFGKGYVPSTECGLGK